MQDLRKYEYIALDLETTGFYPGPDAILEIGAVRFRLDGTVLEEFSQLVDPGIPIPPIATSINGITDAMVAGQPKIGEVLPEFIKFLGDPGMVLCMAHYAQFDVDFIRHAFGITGIEPTAHRIIDTLPIARKRLRHVTRNQKLETLIRHFKIAAYEDHRGLSDSLYLMQVFLEMLKIEPEVTTLDCLLEVASEYSFQTDGILQIAPECGENTGLQTGFRLP